MRNLKKALVYAILYIVTFGIILSAVFLVPNKNNDSAAVRSIIVFFATVLLTKYFIYMLVSPWYDVTNLLNSRPGAAARKRSRRSPRVTVLVPAWNEGEGVITTIQALLKSSHKNTEIILIDNNSTDNTEESAARLILDHGRSPPPKRGKKIDLVYIKEMRQGKGHALNAGIARSTGEIIVSIDADCYVPRDTIANFVKCFRDPTVMAAVGNVKIGNTNTLLGVVQYLEFLFSFYFKKSDSLFGCIYIIGGAAGAFRKEIFDKIGGYSVSNITEDIDLSMRIQIAGMKIAYVEDAVVYTEGASDFKSLILQRLRWKRGRFETFLQHRRLFFSLKKEHNRILTWIILPLALFGDLQLFLEPFFILFIYGYSYITNDYSSFITGIIVVSTMFFVQILFDTRRKSWSSLILLAPIGWLLFYASTLVEFAALVRTIRGYFKKEKVQWQKWKRRGVFVKAETALPANAPDEERSLAKRQVL